MNGNGNAVRARISPVLRAVVDARRKQDTDGDAELIAGHNGASDLPWGNLGHVQDDDGRHEPDTEPGDQTARHDQTEAGRGGLKNNTDDEDNAADDDGGTTPDPVRKITAEESSEEGSGGENRDDKRFLPRGEHEVLGFRLRGVRHAADGVDEKVHPHHTADVTRVVSEEDTTKGRESAHEVGLHRDGRLNTIDIARRGKIYRSARHDDGLLQFRGSFGTSMQRMWKSFESGGKVLAEEREGRVDGGRQEINTTLVELWGGWGSSHIITAILPGQRWSRQSYHQNHPYKQGPSSTS